MSQNRQIAKLQDRLSRSTSRTKDVFKTTHLERILQKHALETHTDDHRREYSAEQWLKTLLLSQIKGFTKIRPFVRQLEQNALWQQVCGLQHGPPDQSQYSRKLADESIQEILSRTFATYQQLIPKRRLRQHCLPTSKQLDVLTAGYRPFRLDCTSLPLSNARYSYAEKGWVACEKKSLPSARVHLLQEGIHDMIVNYAPTSGNRHESPVADELLHETEVIDPWLTEFELHGKLRPLLLLDRGYWKEKRFKDLADRGWAWLIPSKKRTLVGAQIEFLDLPKAPGELLEGVVWVPGTSSPWRRIIGTVGPPGVATRDVLTSVWDLRAPTLLFLQKDRWTIEALFRWLKQNTPLTQPLGTSFQSFVTHCLLLTILYLVLLYFLFLLNISHWKTALTPLLQDLRYSDGEPWASSSLRQLLFALPGGGQ